MFELNGNKTEKAFNRRVRCTQAETGICIGAQSGRSLAQSLKHIQPCLSAKCYAASAVTDALTKIPQQHIRIRLAACLRAEMLRFQDTLFEQNFARRSKGVDSKLETSLSGPSEERLHQTNSARLRQYHDLDRIDALRAHYVALDNQLGPSG